MNNLPRRLSKPGPVIEYLMALSNGAASTDETRAQARRAVKAVQAFFNSEDGLIALELLEKATTDFFLDPMTDARACDALNAQRFIALDLRRIASNEIEHVLEQHRAERGNRDRIRGGGRAGADD